VREEDDSLAGLSIGNSSPSAGLQPTNALGLNSPRSASN
jgi:hypothetical protein